jgi:hypothetical protein
MAFGKNVFVNCPFDRDYFPLLRPLLFTILYLGLSPRIALETVDSGESRLDKIVRLIRESRYSVHDLSRLKAEHAGEFYRLNMPFELGIDFGCRTFGRQPLRTKKTLVLEVDPHRYRAALSDLSGCDIETHDNTPLQVVAAVRKWLKNACGLNAPGPTKIWGDFNDFMADNYDALKADGFSDADVEGLAVPELVERMTTWLSAHRL